MKGVGSETRRIFSGGVVRRWKGRVGEVWGVWEWVSVPGVGGGIFVLDSDDGAVEWRLLKVGRVGGGRREVESSTRRKQTKRKRKREKHRLEENTANFIKRSTAAPQHRSSTVEIVAI